MKRTRITLARLMARRRRGRRGACGVHRCLSAMVKAKWRLDSHQRALACQIGLLCAVLSRGRSRAFWSGFVVFGFAMMVTLAWAGWFMESAANDAWVVLHGAC